MRGRGRKNAFLRTKTDKFRHEPVSPVNSPLRKSCCSGRCRANAGETEEKQGRIAEKRPFSQRFFRMRPPAKSKKCVKVCGFVRFVRRRRGLIIRKWVSRQGAKLAKTLLKDRKMIDRNIAARAAIATFFCQPFFCHLLLSVLRGFFLRA